MKLLEQEKAIQHPKLPDILQELRSYLQNIYGDHLNDLILFGSQARGEAEPDSDIDLLIILKGEVDPWTENQRTSQRISQICLDYSVVICNIFVSVEQFTAKSSALLRNIANEGVYV